MSRKALSFNTMSLQCQECAFPAIIAIYAVTAALIIAIRYTLFTFCVIDCDDHKSFKNADNTDANLQSGRFFAAINSCISCILNYFLTIYWKKLFFLFTTFV